MMRTGALVLALLAMLAAGGWLAIRQTLAGRDFPGLGGKTSAWRYPPDATLEQREALMDHIMRGTPVPAGFTELHNSEVDSSFTGRVDFTSGEMQIAVTVLDDSEDLEEARLIVDGVLQATATRANGGIVERADGDALATLQGWLPPVWSGYRVEVEWDLDPGGARAGGSSYTVKSPLAFWR
jgi:hypothetical protein